MKTHSSIADSAAAGWLDEPTARALAAWHAESGEIIARLDEADLPAVLDRCLNKLVPFDLSVVFAYPDETEPLYLHNGFRGRAPGSAMENYLKGAYLLDPFFTACRNRVAPGLYRMRELAPDNFFTGEYFNSWEVHPCISMESGSLAEEIGFLALLPAGFMVAYSLMRENANTPFSETEMTRLRAVEPIVRQAMTHHWRDTKAVARSPRKSPAWSATGERMEHAFETFGAGILSPREQIIVGMILRGHSSHSIAAELNIAEGTVKNHRKNIYAKLNLSSQQELFAGFIDHLLA